MQENMLKRKGEKKVKEKRDARTMQKKGREDGKKGKGKECENARENVREKGENIVEV